MATLANSRDNDMVNMFTTRVSTLPPQIRGCSRVMSGAADAGEHLCLDPRQRRGAPAVLLGSFVPERAPSDCCENSVWLKLVPDSLVPQQLVEQEHPHVVRGRGAPVGTLPRFVHVPQGNLHPDMIRLACTSAPARCAVGQGIPRQCQQHPLQLPSTCHLRPTISSPRQQHKRPLPQQN